MIKNINIDLVEYRREFLRNELEKIYAVSSGRAVKLTEFISDENGDVTEERIEILIEQLLACLGNCRESWNNPLDSKEEEFYHDFLYCMIQGVASRDYLDFKAVADFSDIVKIAEQTADNPYEDKKSFLTREYDLSDHDLWCRIDKTGFFEITAYAYYLLTGKYISETFTDEEKSLVSDFANSKQASLDACITDLDDDDESYSYDSEGNVVDSDGNIVISVAGLMADEEEISWEIERQAAAEKTEQEWKASVINPDKFVASYMNTRRLYTEISVQNMKRDVENMIDIFLCENRLSVLSDETAHADTVYRIRKTANTIRFRRKSEVK